VAHLAYQLKHGQPEGSYHDLILANELPNPADLADLAI